MTSSGPILDTARRQEQRIWRYVSLRPLASLWDLHGMPIHLLAQRTMNAFLRDNLFGRAAELGYYFLFALFPTLISATAILGLAARSAASIYVRLLEYVALLLPPSAYDIVISTFNQTTASATPGKITFGMVAALWAGSVGVSSMQDAMNVVYKVPETRPYWKSRSSAMLITLLLTVLATLILAALFGGDFLVVLARVHIVRSHIVLPVVILARIAGGTVATLLLSLLIAIIYYFAPDVRHKRWRWFTPGAALSIVFWLLGSLALRGYLHFFNSYSLTYGSLGAVIILLTWFYITGLMLLLGAELNSEIEAYAAEQKLRALPVSALPGP